MSSRPKGILNIETGVGLAAAALGGVLGMGLSGISFGAGYDRIGPRFFPYVVSAGLLALGAWFVAASLWRGEATQQAPIADGVVAGEEMPVRRLPLLYLSLALVLNLVLLEKGGFVMASSLQFWLVARAFGSTRPLRDAAGALVIATICYVAFSHGLGLTLPPGILGFIEN